LLTKIILDTVPGVRQLEHRKKKGGWDIKRPLIKGRGELEKNFPNDQISKSWI